MTEKYLSESPYVPGEQIIKFNPVIQSLDWYDRRPAGFDNEGRPITALLVGDPRDPKAAVIGFLCNDEVMMVSGNGLKELRSLVKSVRDAITDLYR